jgi:transposase-like protein
MDYSQGFREAAVKKMLEPGARSVAGLSRELGVSEQTLYNWRKQFRVITGREEQKERTPRQWTVPERYDAILHAASLTEETYGEWLRAQGLRSDDIDTWKKELRAMTSTTKDKEELKMLRKKCKEIERELSRKDRALAEVSALLVLKKKVDLLWGGSEDK